VRNLLYKWYEAKLEHGLRAEDLPKHIGLMADGNRRWAKEQGAGAPGVGHAAGARKIVEFVQWCTDLGIQHVTLYLLSTDNLKGRSASELSDLLEIIASLAEELLSLRRWRLKIFGDLGALPAEIAQRLRRAEQESVDFKGPHVNLAVAYGGRLEIADAMRKILKSESAAGLTLDQLAEMLTPDLIAEHLYSGGQPDPDLLIRTSGEQRLSGFLLWQSANSEFYFAEALWPDFRRVDFLRAIRDFEKRHRRFGS
jgi:short-chain Z-isoprenyl diphosphate synthase